ncbi:MAG: TetR/AcrR family transcriptional regulator [Symbiobacteriia bacterium]
MSGNEPTQQEYLNGDTLARALGPKGEATRQRLLVAAEEVFGTLQYHGASISEITRRAGVAQGTFYLYFPSKQAIYRELVQHLSRSMRTHIAIAVSALEDRMAVERQGLHAFLSFVREHHYLYRIVREAEFVDEEIYRWFYRHLAEGYRRGLTAAAGKAQVRDLEPETVAYCLMGVADFIGMRWVLWEDQEPPQEVFETVMAFIAGGLQLPSGKGEGAGA